MSAAGQDPTARKTSGSSSRSSGQSPMGSPNTSQPHRNNTLSTSNPMFKMGMGSAASLNPGWQVWGGPRTPTSQRDPSVSSSTSMTDSSPSQGGAGISDGWGARPAGANWDWAATNNPVDARPVPLSHKQRIRLDQPGTTSYQGLRTDNQGIGAYSSPNPTPPELLIYHQSAPPVNTVISNSQPVFGGQQASIAKLPSAFETPKGRSAVDSDLAMGMRGMAVEDDRSGQHHPALRQPTSEGFGASIHPAGTPQHTGNVYTSFGQPEYATYYAALPSGVDYPYQYDNYRGPAADPKAGGTAAQVAAPSPGGMYGILSPHPDGRQHGLYFDYAGPPRPSATQYYYTPPPMMYPSHSPMPTPQLSPATPIVHDKMHNFLYGSVRSTPSPHPQVYGSAMDYATQLSLMFPAAAMYGPMGPNHQTVHLYQPTMRSNRIGPAEPSVMSLRSPLLDEFRANKTRKWELRDIFGYIVEFSGDQHGSRFIQQKLEVASAEERQVVFDEIVPDNALQLIQDVFGNYVVQKLFEYGTQVHKAVLAKTMEGHVLSLSLQMYGCRVVQKAVECILSEQQSVFVAELEIHALKCVKDANGNHVIQKLLERVAPERLGFIQAFKGHIYDLSTHPYGCRVLQRCFEHLPEEQTRPLLDELHKYTLNLMQDQFGNYVIQFVLEHGKLADRALVVQKLRGQLLQMARHKFASNVCEKALLTADRETRETLLQEIITPRPDGVSPVMMMMKDQYANYVLQRALSVADGAQREALISKIKPQLSAMRRYSSAYSKHLVSIEKLVENASAQSRAEQLAAGVQTSGILELPHTAE